MNTRDSDLDPQQIGPFVPEGTVSPERVLNLFNLSKSGWTDYFRAMGEPPFRVTQLLQWIYRRGCLDFDQMSNLNQSLRTRLKQELKAELPEISQRWNSTDGTIKWSMKASDGSEIETVYIPEATRGTLCISSQVGCILGCRFCATGQQGFQRNLSLSEIIGQVWQAALELGQWTPRLESELLPLKRMPITNIVFMGMGEPLLNLKAVVETVQLLLDPHAWGLSKRRVTVSTSGIVPAINALNAQVDVALAVSLHAPIETLRSELMPINKQYPLAQLIPALEAYYQNSSANAGGLTLEYTLLDGVNDHDAHARQLAHLFKKIPIKVNLIPWNCIPNTPYHPTPMERIQRFAAVLAEANVFSTIRKTRGADIAAACGQLVGVVKNRLRQSLLRADQIAARGPSLPPASPQKQTQY